MSNSQAITLPPNTQVFILAHTNAWKPQSVTIKGLNDTQEATFSGQGENQPMKLDVRSNTLIQTAADGGWPYFQTPAGDPKGVDYIVTVEGPANSIVHSGGGEDTVGGRGTSIYATKIVVSEDSTDNDYNDCALLFVYFVPKSAPTT